MNTVRLRPRQCTCPRDRDVVGPTVTLYRRTSRHRPERLVSSRRITHYGPGEQVTWHWIDQAVVFNTWYRWLPVLDAEPRTAS